MISEASQRPADANSVAVVLVNYCTRDLTVDCLRSLEGEIAQFPGSQVIVADNASPDGSGPEIAAAIAENGWGAWARVLLLPKNGGFSYGNNAAIREVLASPTPPAYIWLLNTDTVARPGALRPLIAFLAGQSKVGATGSRLEHLDGARQASAFRFHSIAGEFEVSLAIGVVTKLLQRWKVAPQLPDEPTRFDWLSGASVLFRSDVFRDVGLLDEGYFLYFEETDFFRRADQRGWTSFYVPESRVVHFVGKSTGVTNVADRRARRAPYWFQSRRRYFIKHHGVLYAALADAALAGGTVLAKLLDFLRRRPSQHPKWFLTDLARENALFNRSLDGHRS